LPCAGAPRALHLGGPPPRDRVRAHVPAQPMGALHVAETSLAVDHAVAALRQMVSAWMALRAGTDDHLARSFEGKPLFDFDVRAQMLSVYLQDALSAFAPRVMYLDAADDVDYALRVTQAPLYCVLCLQLAHAIAANASYRVCAYEPCSRPFTVQAGRSAHGRHRGDSIYHDAVCAVRAAQRKYRQKRRRQAS
jgi:hypothetical protein